ncbi:MAG TPA: antibiotic biosynthesis monooxygenase family protein [Ktedonobacterales bacterium]|nr:antibiotic biosynthesis monooxygenase family protein [Ktedonobacterales bacterium]
MIIAVTRINAPAPALDRMAEAFRQSARDLLQFSGFIGLELWRNADTLEAISRWVSREALDAYTASDAFRAHHGGAPQGGGGGVEYYEGEEVI